jgi:hypothetical protein
MSLNIKKYYTSGSSFRSKGNIKMLNAIERNAFKPTRKLQGQKKSFVNTGIQNMKCGGKVHKMPEGGEIMELTDKEIQNLRNGGYTVIEQ